MKEFIFIWKIENISYSWHKTGEEIFSPLFTAGPIENSIWMLELYPRGYEISDYFSVYLRRCEDNGPEKICVNFELSCISADNSILQSCTFPDNHKSFTRNDGFGHPRFFSRHEVFVRKTLYIPKDVLTIRCRMWKNEGITKECAKSFGLTSFPIERVLLVENLNSEITEEKTVYINSEHQNKSLLSISLFQHEDSIKVEISPINAEHIKFSVLKLSFMEKSSSRKIFCEHTSSWLDAPSQELWSLPIASKILNAGNENLVENAIELIGEFIYSNGEKTEHLYYNNICSSRLPEDISKYISCIAGGNQSDIPTISQDLWSLFVEQDYCDLEIKTRTTSLFVHKIVMCARSPVFLAMLTSDMKEKINNCIEIDDMKDDILKKFLLFLYTDNLENLDWEVAIHLYCTADKYQVVRLKISCFSYLLQNLDVDNVIELLMLADKHHDSEFKSRLEDFILQNDERLFSSSAWKQFVNEQPSLAAKAMLLKYDKGKEKLHEAETFEEKLSRLSKVQGDLKVLYKDKILTDVVIKTVAASFSAHKTVLCASSSTLKEKLMSTDSIEILDLEDDIVSRLLPFLYADSLEDAQWDTAIKLYRAANLYQIQRLKIRCSCFLLENLEISNACDLLLVAHNHGDINLKSTVEDYILTHDEEIFGSDVWADFSETNLRLANETMRLKYRKK